MLFVAVFVIIFVLAVLAQFAMNAMVVTSAPIETDLLRVLLVALAVALVIALLVSGAYSVFASAMEALA